MHAEPSLRIRLHRAGPRWEADAAHDARRWRRLRTGDGRQTLFLFRAHDRQLEDMADSVLATATWDVVSRGDWPGLCALLEIDFALVALDLPGRVLLARGGVGRERLFHRSTSDGVEIQSDLLGHVDPDAVDRNAFAAYLASAAGPVSGDLTFTTRTVASASGWTRCLRATVTQLDLNTGKTRVARAALRLDEALARLSDDDLAHAMREAVAAHLRRRMPDGPSAVELSGGIDSSIIAATLARLEPAHAHVGIGVTYPYYEFRQEPRYMQDMAGKAAIEHVALDGRDRLLFDPAPTPGLITSEPSLVLMGHAYKSLVIDAAVRTGTQVLFNGHGGDQLFAMSPYTRESLVRRLDFRLLEPALRAHVQGQIEAYRDDLERRDELGQRHYFAGLLLYDGWMEDFARGTGLRCEPGLLSLRTLQLSWEMFRRPHLRDAGILRKRFARQAFSRDLPASILTRRWKVGYDGLYRRGLHRNAARLGALVDKQAGHLRAMGVRVERCLEMLERVRDMRFDDVELLYPLLCYALWRASFDAEAAPAR